MARKFEGKLLNAQKCKSNAEQSRGKERISAIKNEKKEMSLKSQLDDLQISLESKKFNCFTLRATENKFIKEKYEAILSELNKKQ